jgi:hypothetical protein
MGDSVVLRVIVAAAVGVSAIEDSAIARWAGGHGRWDNATQWLPQVVPSSNSGVIIDEPQAMVTVESSINVASFQALAGTLSVIGSTVDLNATSIQISSGASVLSKGSLSLHANILNVSTGGHLRARSLRVSGHVDKPRFCVKECSYVRTQA